MQEGVRVCVIRLFFLTTTMPPPPPPCNQTTQELFLDLLGEEASKASGRRKTLKVHTCIPFHLTLFLTHKRPPPIHPSTHPSIHPFCTHTPGRRRGRRHAPQARAGLPPPRLLLGRHERRRGGRWRRWREEEGGGAQVSVYVSSRLGCNVYNPNPNLEPHHHTKPNDTNIPV